MSINSDIPPAFSEIQERAKQDWQKLNSQTVVTVGTATCGRAAGALKTLEAIKDEIKKLGLNVPVLEVGCLGHCYAEPLVIISKPEYPPICYGKVNEVVARRLVNEFVLGNDPCLEYMLGALTDNEIVPSLMDFPRAKFERKIILKNCGQIDPESIDQYVARGGYSALTKGLTMTPENIISEVKNSGLSGMGGAGFPTGGKWEACRESGGKIKYIIANGDQGDPGAFMDRVIMESDPHSIIEGMIIGAYAVGARHGYVYIRSEYPLAIARMRHAIRQANKFSFLGKNILASNFSFDIHLFRGSGAFVCGEETALIASIEGSAGMPRPRPPYPAVKGLFGKPTLVNNVKTFAYISFIINKGASEFSRTGTPKSKGTAVFALAGKVANNGLIEVPMGTTLRQIIYDIGGGIAKGKRFKAVQIGGPSGGCLPESALNLPVDFDSLSKAGAMMGSGGMVVLDEDDCMVEVARYFLEFTQRESCGKCTFCRLGTKQMLTILEDITNGHGKMEDLATLETLAEEVKAGSLCGLGRTAPNPVITTLRYFRDEYEAHIREGRCPALMCPELITYYILPQKCERSCDACVGACTVEAIYSNEQRIKVIDQAKCVKCGTCITACPAQYNAIVKLSPPGKLPK